jgi:hypothetical protein
VSCARQEGRNWRPARAARDGRRGWMASADSARHSYPLRPCARALARAAYLHRLVQNPISAKHRILPLHCVPRDNVVEAVQLGQRVDDVARERARARVPRHAGRHVLGRRVRQLHPGRRTTGSSWPPSCQYCRVIVRQRRDAVSHGQGMVWYGMVPLLPPGPQSLRPGGGSWIGRRLSMLRLSPFKVVSTIAIQFTQPLGKRAPTARGLEITSRSTCALVLPPATRSALPRLGRARLWPSVDAPQ